MIDGFINIYKEQGFTSFDVVAKLRGILKQKKIGHTGTLDPMAEGVLLVCLGSATKMCDLLTEKNKTYTCTMLLGKTSDTEDVTGVMTDVTDVYPDEKTVMKFGASWFMPAGDSYIANMYADAGADYVFKELPGAGSTPLAFETVLDRAIHADMWLIKYNQSEDMTYGDLRAEYAPYENFDAFKNRRIYSCNTGLVPYYEEFPLHPDYLLKDLIWVFHPELLPGYSPRYYRKMQD